MINKYLRNDYTLLTLFIITVVCIFVFSDFLPNLYFPESEILISLVIVTSLFHKLRLHKLTFADFGFYVDKTLLRNVIITIALLLIMILSVFIFNVMISYGSFFQSTNVTQEVWYGVAFTLSFAIIEELVFRGIAFQILIDKAGTLIAILISSIIFTIAHGLNPGLSIIAIVNIFLAGLLMSLMYVRSGSFLPQILFHFGWNFSLAYIIGSPVSGYNMPNQIIQNVNTSEFSLSQLLFGGNFGLEGGLLASILLVLMIILCVKYFQESPYISSKHFHKNYDISN